MNFKLLALVGVLGLGLSTAACAGSADEPQGSEDSAAATDELRAASSSVLVGTFALQGDADPLRFHTLTLKADGSFSAIGGCRGGGSGAAHCHAITSIKGTWKVKSSGGAQLELVDSFGQKDVFFYKMESDQLSLKTTKTGHATVFDKDLSHLPKLKTFDVCADKNDNTLGQCEEDFVCVADGDSDTQRCSPPI